MSVLFYILGLVLIVGGAGWSFLIFTSAASQGGLSLAVAMATFPGASVVFAGFLFLGLSGILYSLKRISRNTGDAADALDELVNRLPKA